MFIFDEGSNPAHGTYDVVDGSVTQQLTTVTLSAVSKSSEMAAVEKKKSKHKSKHKNKKKASPKGSASTESEPVEEYVLVD